VSFAQLVGHEHNRQILQRLLRQGRVGASLIFAGPEGVGKRQFALTFAKAANCRSSSQDERALHEDSCDTCPSCSRIEARVSSDVAVVVPDGAYIKIAQTRALSNEVQYRPREGRQRFFLIDDADRLREEAANSLLKTLEEPPPTSTIILLTARPDALLPTILSRTQRINFAPLSIPEMETYLARRQRPAADQKLLARLSEGRIGQALKIDLSAFRQDRREIIELVALVAAGQDGARILKAAEYFGRRERDSFEEKLELLMLVLRDIFLLANGRPKEETTNIDEAERLSLLASSIGVRRLSKWVTIFTELRRNLDVNINRQVATEAALMDLV
jgi:DNA polymerase-3 subunit delta'